MKRSRLVDCGKRTIVQVQVAWLFVGLAVCLLACVTPAQEPASKHLYLNQLTPIPNPAPLLADHPEFVEPIPAGKRFEAPPLIQDNGADLTVRTWRFSYNARGTIEVPNALSARHTAVIVVHPWGVDDGQGWKSPEPAGVALFCTPEKNKIYHQHLQKVVNPFLKDLRGKVHLIAYSLPGKEDTIRKKMYRSIHGEPSTGDRRQGVLELAAKLRSFRYQGEPVQNKLTVQPNKAAIDYFQQFPGLDAGPRFNNAGFWDLPIPVAKPIEVAPRDVVIYDAEGYGVLRDFLKKQGIRHVLLTGYATDMCLCKTTAGYENLAKDFNVFIVGDATLATFPASDTPRFATATALANASLNHFVTQVSWVRWLSASDRLAPRTSGKAGER
jgi:nicotinamidase-related amidase